MTAKSLFNIILKVLGIYFLKDAVVSATPLVGIVYQVAAIDTKRSVIIAVMSLLPLFVYAFVAYWLIFKTDVVIEKLRLLDKLPEDPIPLNVHRSTVINIAVLLVSLLLITQAIPPLVGELVQWYQYRRSIRDFEHISTFDYTSLLVQVGQIIVGLLLIGNQRAIVHFIELRQRRERSIEEAPE